MESCSGYLLRWIGAELRQQTQQEWAEGDFQVVSKPSPGAIFASAEPAPRHNPAAGDFGPQYPLAGRAVRGPPGNQTGQVAFWDLQVRAVCAGGGARCGKGVCVCALR